MGWSVSFAPVLPVWLIAALGIVGLGLLAFALSGRIRGTWLRTLALAALVLALLNPVILREDRESLPTIVALVVDKSASQNLDNRDKVTAAAKDQLVREFGKYRDVDLRLIEAGNVVKGVLSDGTELFGALQTGLADVPPDRLGGIVVVTDGQVHDAPAGRPSFAPGAPVHVLLTGRDNERDRRIAIETAPRFGIVGQNQVITYRVIDDGVAPGSSGRVQVKVSLDGETLTTTSVVPGERSTVSVKIVHGGANIIELEAAALPGELTPLNNHAVAEIAGIRENLRVLLVSGEPHPGERTWRNLLKSDPSVDLIHFTILRPPAKQDGTPINQLSLIAFPTRELFQEKIQQFDLIIFDHYQQRGILPNLYFDNIANYVKKGGAVLISSGPDTGQDDSVYSTPLISVLPGPPTGRVFQEPYFPTVSEKGQRHPVTRDLNGSNSNPPAWSRWFQQMELSNPRGDIVMTGAQNAPLLILNHEGQGRVGVLLSDQVWLWARGFEGGGPQVDLLRRLAHWLMKEPDLEEEALRATSVGGRIEVRRRTLATTFPPVTMTAPDGSTRTLALNQASPGVGLAVIDVDKPGLYRFDDGTLRTVAAVGNPDPLEFSDVRATEAKLKPMVDASGGTIMWLADTSDPEIRSVRPGRSAGGSDWIGLRRNEGYTVAGINQLPLLPGILVALAFLLAVGSAWWREGR